MGVLQVGGEIGGCARNRMGISALFRCLQRERLVLGFVYIAKVQEKALAVRVSSRCSSCVQLVVELCEVKLPELDSHYRANVYSYAAPCAP